MGYQLAEAAFKRKHKVTLISGPTHLNIPEVDRFIRIETADDLLKALKKEISRADVLIMCAAVSDFKPRRFIKNKIKRNKNLSLELVPNKDLLVSLEKYKKNKLFIGFSLETKNLIKSSYGKLVSKNLDLIAANRLTKQRNIFGDNKLDMSILDKTGIVKEIKGKTKPFIAHVLLDKIEKLWYHRIAYKLKT
jgi:phosphopantothenoylcysteine decarboxylase / phosphopantothenate---cysteine ligase